MSDIDYGSASDRVLNAFESDFELCCYEAAKELAPLVESEIELMVLASFKIMALLSDLSIGIGEDFASTGDPQLLVTPQFNWSRYRIDLCVRLRAEPEKLVFVECDGHEFHERTKDQAERDRSKDREIQSAGIPILRFTGREIWRNPQRVCIEIINFVASGARK